MDNPRTYDFAAISGLPSVIQESTLVCISNGVGGGLMSNAQWKGVPLRTLLEQSAPRNNVRDVVFHGVDGYTDTFALDKAMDPTTLVAYEMNGLAAPTASRLPGADHRSRPLRREEREVDRPHPPVGNRGAGLL
ncbi:MAG: molybdopterin-dependent oxidoreductase [Actinomycetota bacterium]|nr:molybdopterin-dependent oxidoreductase [Actinomycetota bacterium]